MLCHKNGRAVVLFQLCIIVFAMEGPIEASVSLSTWSCLMLLLVAALLFTLVSQRHGVKWQRIHRVGLFLIARNAIPDPSYIVSSFLYSQLQSTPVLLQALSIVNMGTTTLSSWSFGKIFARYNHGWPLLKLMAGTTVMSSLWSLGNLAIVAKAHEGSHSWVFHVVVFCVGAITTFAAEWQFLPNVVLATAAVGNRSMQEEQIEEVNSDIQDVTTAAAPLIRGNVAVGESTIDSTGILYGTLMSCIDFGDQIGAWVTVPLVTALGISRENDWAGLNEMIVLTSVLGLLSVLLLGILKDERA